MSNKLTKMVSERRQIQTFYNNQINRYYLLSISIAEDFWEIIFNLPEGTQLISGLDMDGYFRSGLEEEYEDSYDFRIALAFQSQNQIDEFEDYLTENVILFGLMNQEEYLQNTQGAYIFSQDDIPQVI